MDGLVVMDNVSSVHALGSLQGMFIQVYGETPDALAVEDLARMYASLPGVLAQMVVVDRRVRVPPGADFRKAVARLLEAEGHRVVASAIVLETQGFVGSAARGVLASIQALYRYPYPERVLGTAGEGAQFLKATAPQAVVPNTVAIIRAVEELRARVMLKRA
jgi:hypothetical protein